MPAWVAPLAAVVAASWVALLVAAPYTPAPLAAFLYLFGSVICHQIADRSFHLDGAQLPVCARCLGIYAGTAIGAIAVVGRALTARQARREAAPDDLRVLIAATIPTLATVLLELTGIHASNLARALAGAPLGAAVALVVMAALREPALHYGECARN